MDTDVTILAEEHDAHVALENRITNLLYLAESITKTSGMNQTFALEAMDLLPGFGGDTPIGYYSKDTSATRYKVSLEELNKGVWGLIVSACKALVDMIVKFIKWMFGSDGKDTKVADNMEKVTHSLEENSKLIEDLAKLYAEKANEANLTDDKTKEENATKAATESLSIATEDILRRFSHKLPRNIDELIKDFIEYEGKDSELAKVLRVEDPLLNDLLHSGEYAKAIKSVGRIISVIPAKAKESVAEYLKMTEEVRSNVSKIHEQSGEKVKKDPITVDMFGNGKTVTIGDGVKTINEARRAVMEKDLSTTSIIPFSKINEMVLNAIKKTDIESILRKVEAVEKELYSLREPLIKANDDIVKISDTLDLESPAFMYAISLREAFMVTRTDVIDCLKFFREIMIYANTLLKIDSKLHAIQKTVITVVESAIKENLGFLPPEFKELHKRIRDAIEEHNPK